MSEDTFSDVVVATFLEDIFDEVHNPKLRTDLEKDVFHHPNFREAVSNYGGLRGLAYECLVQRAIDQAIDNQLIKARRLSLDKGTEKNGFQYATLSNGLVLITRKLGKSTRLVADIGAVCSISDAEQIIPLMVESSVSNKRQNYLKTITKMTLIKQFYGEKPYHTLVTMAKEGATPGVFWNRDSSSLWTITTDAIPEVEKAARYLAPSDAQR